MKKVLYILLLICFFGQSQPPYTAAELETDFYVAWNTGEAKQQYLDFSLSGGQNQQHYYVYGLWAAIRAWQATGNYDLLEYCKTIVNNLRSTATPASIPEGYSTSNYIDFEVWPANSFNTTNPFGSDLWDFYMSQAVGHFLGVLAESPTIIEKDRVWYEDQIQWWYHNLWEKYKHMGGQYASNIHSYGPYGTGIRQAYAQGMYKATKKTELKQFIDEYNYVGYLGANNVYGGLPASLTTQLRDTLIVASGNTGYQLAANWHNPPPNDLSFNGNYPDALHFSTIPFVMTIDYENGGHWTLSDLQKWAVTWNELIWNQNTPLSGLTYINGTGTQDIANVIIGWQSTLGAFVPSFQLRMETYINSQTGSYMKEFLMANILYNRVIADEGRPIYPEYYHLDNGLTDNRKRILKKKKTI